MCGKKGGESIQKHPFFKEINFQDLNDKKILPPWVPEVSDEADFSHIEDAPDSRRYESISEGHQTLFVGF